MARFTVSDLSATAAEGRLQHEGGLDAGLAHDVEKTARLNAAYAGRVVPLVNRHAILHDDLQTAQEACTHSLEQAAVVLVKGGKVADLSGLTEQQVRLPVLRSALRIVAESIKPTPAESRAARAADRRRYLELDVKQYTVKLAALDGEIAALTARAQEDAEAHGIPSPVRSERLQELEARRRMIAQDLAGCQAQLVTLGAAI